MCVCVCGYADVCEIVYIPVLIFVLVCVFVGGGGGGDSGLPVVDLPQTKFKVTVVFL